MTKEVNFVQVSSHINWDEYFMLQAIMASFKSKDPNTKVGCVFVDDNNHQLSMGYNGQIAGIDESKTPWNNDKSLPLQQQKYAYVVHSEANAILHAKSDLSHSKCYVTLFPCHECAKMIATVKVKEVIFLSDKYHESEENLISKRIFDMTGIKYRELKIRREILLNMSEYFSTITSNFLE